MQYRTITEGDWKQFPESKPAKPANQWDGVVEALESGAIIVLDVPEEKLRGTRIGVARVAARKGTKLTFRYQNGQLAIRKADMSTENGQDEEPIKPKRARTRKEEAS